MSDSIFHSAQSIRALEEIIGYVFKDKSLLDRALQAAGFGFVPEGNKRPALIGDAALRLVLFMAGYENNASTSYMTNLQNTQATNTNLSQGVVGKKLMATTMEAILGAVYLDSRDIAAVLGVVIRLGLVDAA